jgi:hypothetical protein
MFSRLHHQHDLEYSTQTRASSDSRNKASDASDRSAASRRFQRMTFSASIWPVTAFTSVRRSSPRLRSAGQPMEAVVQDQ